MNSRFFLGSVSTAVIASAFPMGVLAQEDRDLSQDSSSNETIVVKGQKREETLLESDLSVTVFDETAIREARLRDFRRIDDLVPNVQFNEASQLSSVFVSIRGIESNPFIVNRAAIYIDGIPFRELSNSVLNQISSIEVLRGPQSTLYGANSEAGLILITTRQPDDEFEGQVRLTGSTFNGDFGYGVDGFVGGTLIEDKLVGSIAFAAAKEDAYISNPASSIGEPGEVRDLFLQGRLSYAPNEDLSINATAYILDTLAPGLFDQEFAPVDRTLYDATYRDLFNGGRSVGRFEFLNDAPKRTVEQNIVAGLSATYQLGYGAIDAAVSYANTDEDSSGLDLDGTAFPSAAGRDVEVETVYSAEIRFTSPDSEVFEYLIGGSWFRQEEDVQLGTALGEASLDSYQLSPPQAAQAQDFAIFGSATAGLGLDGLSGTVGLRWDRAKRRTQQQAGLLDLGFTQLVFQDISLESTYTEVLPRGVISYEPTNSLNLYISASKGYIPGGFNLAAAEADLGDEIIQYDQESIWSYEGGLKFQLPDNMGYVNIAGFYIESDNWQEVQVLINDDGEIASSAFIAARASIESIGFEIETAYDITDNLSLRAGFGYTDATYRNFQVSETENLRGLPVKLVSEFDGNVALRYETEDGFFARGEVSFTGDMPLDERSSAVQEAVAVMGLQAGYEGDRYSVRLFVENLTNERIFSGLTFPNAAGDDGNLYAPLDAPRIVGLEVEANF
ncbi:MAG: TonB-dependent receptor [Pseudomonadota bacterium]